MKSSPATRLSRISSSRIFEKPSSDIFIFSTFFNLHLQLNCRWIKIGSLTYLYVSHSENRSVSQLPALADDISSLCALKTSPRDNISALCALQKWSVRSRSSQTHKTVRR
eukprot:UN21999